MQISDLVNQYHNNLASGSEVSTGTKGVEQLVSTIREMTRGHMFEGTVNSVKGTQVILGLSSGQNITARVEKGIPLEKGQSMFFQVKSNDGVQIQIRPVSFGTSNNPTLLSALDAASLPVTEDHLNMVNSMMSQQMPIDAKSLMDMSRVIHSISGAQVDTVVEMMKLNLPVSEELAIQFENYKNDQGAILDDVNQIVDAMGDVFHKGEVSPGEMISFHQQVVEILTGTGDISVNMQNSHDESAAGILEQIPQDVVSQEVLPEEALPQKVVLLPQEEYPVNTLGNVLPEEEFQELNQVVQNLFRDIPTGELPLQLQQMAKEGMNPQVTVQEFMTKLSSVFPYLPEEAREEAVTLFRTKGYHQLLGNLTENKLMMTPQEYSKKEEVQEYFKELLKTGNDLMNLSDKLQKAGDTLAKSAQNMKSNVEFLHFVNQNYSFLPVPMRFFQQNVNSQLYVYSNKGKSGDESQEHTAFLHFDMEHLGSTDISVRMNHRKIDTHFYMEKEDAFQLISNNIHLLEGRLQKKGYDCSIQVDWEKNSVDFVEDFLKKDMKTAGKLHRYSFDVRA